MLRCRGSWEFFWAMCVCVCRRMQWVSCLFANAPWLPMFPQTLLPFGPTRLSWTMDSGSEFSRFVRYTLTDGVWGMRVMSRSPPRPMESLYSFMVTWTTAQATGTRSGG